MNQAIQFFTKRGLSLLAMVSITGVTLATSFFGVANATKNFTTKGSIVPEVKQIREVEQNTLAGTSNQQSTNFRTESSPSTVPPTPTGRPIPIRTPTLTPSPIVHPNPAKTVASQTTVNNSNKCIITLFGQQYDVTPLQTGHSGGNIFNCGTDMTAAYQAQHGTNIIRMQGYLVSNTTTALPTAIPSTSTTVKRERQIDNDTEDEDSTEHDVKKQEIHPEN